MKLLLTGSAGFIGYHTAIRLLSRGDVVVGLDAVNDYYDPRLKESRLAHLSQHDGFTFCRADLSDRNAIDTHFAEHDFDAVIHLAAQAGVRYSIENPHAYVQANLVGFANILEACRHHDVGHLVFASTSSIYGANSSYPLSEDQSVDHPMSFYAATKKANEAMAHSYASLYGLPCTGLRFFTVYGPWGRPDMALFLFTRAILAGEPIKIFNHGDMVRDFTYVDDIVSGIVGVLDHPAQPDPDWSSDAPDPGTSFAPYRVFNIGNGNPVPLMEFIEAIEECLGREAKKEFLPMQPGDVRGTHASVDRLDAAVGFRPDTPVKEGVRRFVEWYLEYYHPDGIPPEV